MDSESVTLEALSTWCQVHLGSGVDALLFDAGFATRVHGLRLSDGREVVVRVRPYTPRLRGTAAVHAQLWQNGFACPQPLVALEPYGALWISAESLVRGGHVLADEPDAPELYASALANLVSRAPAPEQVPSLVPPPGMVKVGPHRTWFVAAIGARGYRPQPAAVAEVAAGCRTGGARATPNVLRATCCRSRRLVVAESALEGSSAARRVRLG
jgi:hypothetical protein